VQASAAALRRSLESAPADVRAAVMGIGISVPGPVDPWRGVVIETPNMGPAFRDVPLAEEMEKALGLPAFLDRDTNVAALGEMSFGGARGCDDFVYITVSTGIGGAIVSRGLLFHGPDGTAGELGHTPVDMEVVCTCGGIGHLEGLAGGRGMALRAQAATREGRSPFLAARAAAGSVEAIEGSDVAAGEEAGDPTCIAIMERARRAFAIACAGFVNALNPSRIVVGGSIADAQGDRLLDPARAEISARAFHTPARRVRVVPAELGGDVGLAGGHPLVIARLGDPAWRGGRATPTPARNG
jgi:glucokinase